MLTIRQTLRLACLAVAGVAVAYCSNDEFEGAAPKGQTVITAGFEQPGAQTRTSVGASYEVLWMNGDAFKLFYTESATQKSAEFSTTQDGVAEANFTTSPGLPEAITPSYAIYPAAYVTSLGSADNVLTMTLPKNFTGNSGHSDGPMYADASEGYDHLSFRHLCGLLKLTVTNLPTTAKQFVISADQNLAGTATAKLSDETPVLAITDGSGASKAITVSSVNVTSETTTQTFYIPIPVGNYTNLTAKVTDERGSAIDKYQAKVWPYVSVERAAILYATFGFDLTVNASVGSGSISEAIQAAAPKQDLTTQTTTSVLVEGTLDTGTAANATIEVPVKTNSDIALTFNQVPTNTSTTPLTIAETGAGSSAEPAAESKNVLTVSIPGTESSNQPTLVITTPNSTTELATTGSAATFASVTALTANNTLVINNGVTVTDLTVKGGNIRIRKGATVTGLTKGWTGDETVTVYVEDGANCPSLPDGFVSKSSDLQKAFTDGGEVTLSSNVELTEVLVVKDGKEVTLDLNGFSLTPKSNTKLTAETGCYSGSLIVVRRGGKLTINDSSNGKGLIDSKNEIMPGTTQPYVYADILLVDYNEDKTAVDKKATLIINGGTFKAPWYAISGNGTQHGTDVTIKGGKFISTEGPGIYHPQEGTLTITGGDITGAETGIELRSGTLNISGGTLTSTADPATVAPNGSGTTTAGAALAVAQHTTKKDINVTISGGTFNGVYALFQKDIQNNGTDNVVMNVTGGTFNGDIYSQNCSGFITGGTFSDPSVVTNYLAQNAVVNVVLNKDYTGPGFGLYNTAHSGYGKGANISVDLNNHVWNVKDTPLFGSPGYESQYFHLEMGTVVTFKNGTIQPAESASGKMMIQNYCTLTLDNVTLIGGDACSYVVSNNNGSCVMDGTTITASADNCAFDVYSFSSYAGVTVTVKAGSVINGRVEFDGNNSKQNGTLIVEGGTFNGNLKVNSAYVKSDKSNLQVKGGSWGSYTGWSDYVVSSGN